MKTISMVIIGLVFWIISLTQQEELLVPILTMVATAVNSMMFGSAFYRIGVTKFSSPFVACSYWVGMSAISPLHTCWQTQMVAFGILTALIIFSGITYEEEAIEESFLITLLCCFLSPMRTMIIVGILLLWSVLIVKGLMTWRMWVASCIAISLRVLLMLALHQFQMWQAYWIENLSRLSWQEWVTFIAIFIGIVIATLLPLRKASVLSGSLYITFVLASIIAGGILLL